MKLKRWLTGFFTILFFSMFSSNIYNSQVLDDPLQGSTIGTQIGGTFTSEGYKPGTGSNHILYTVPSQVINGYVEFDIKGFLPSELIGTGNDHAFIAMYDGRGIGNNPSWADFRDNYFRWNFHWRQSASVFKSVVNCAAPTSARINSSYAIFKEDMNNDGIVDIDDRDWYDEPSGSAFSWDNSKTKWYKIKVEWNNKTYKVYVDGQVVWSNHKAGLYDYSPVDHKIWLGSGIDKYDSDNPNVIYRNFKLVNLGGSSSYLTISPGSQTVSSPSGSITYSISSNVNWSVDDNAGWVNLSPTSGNGNATLTATFDENTSSTSRTGSITLTGSGITKTATIVQEGKPSSNYLTVSPTSKNVSSTSGSTTYTISSDLSWTAIDNATWINLSSASGSGNATLTATFDENFSSNSRTGSITIEGGGISKIVTLVQEGQTVPAYLTVTPSNIDVSASSGTVPFTIASNITWDSRDDSDWLSKSPNNGVGDGTLNAIYSSNTSPNSRVATITLTGGGFSKDVTVTQAGTNAYLTVNPSEFNIEDTSGTVSFNITSNSSWTLSQKSSWISLSALNGNGDSLISISFSANNSYDSRTDTISIMGSGLTKIVTILQQGIPFVPYITVTPNSKTVDAQNGTVNFEIESNIDWSVNDDADWLSKSTEDSSGNATLTILYDANNDTTQRIAIISITGNEITQTITITQEGASLFEIIAVSYPIAASVISGNGSFIENSSVTLICTPNPGWKFLRWSENFIEVSPDSIYTFNVDKSRNLTAELMDISTSISNNSLDLPDHYELVNNYPNPFNPTTIISYALPEGTYVKLAIFNLLGQKLVELVNEYKPQGFHTINFNAGNLPSGTYIYQIETANFSQTKKLILLK